MSSALTTDAPPPSSATRAARAPRPRRPKRAALAAHGEPMLWLSGGALVVCVVMVVGLVLLIVRMGLGTFWPAAIEQVTLFDGTTYMGEVTRQESFRAGPEMLAALASKDRARADAEMAADGGSAGDELHRRLFRTGNYDLTNRHFQWIDDFRVTERTHPEWALVLERVEWGRFYGFPATLLIDGKPVATEPAEIWEGFQEHHELVRGRWRERRALERHDLGRTFRTREQARLDVREVELTHDLAPAWTKAFRAVYDAEQGVRRGDAAPDEVASARAQLDRVERNAGRPHQAAVQALVDALDTYARAVEETEVRNERIIQKIRQLNGENARFALALTTAEGREKVVPLDQIVRAHPANRLGLGDKLAVYLGRWWEFLTDEPREANSEGGVFPAIIGTVLMTLIMAVLVVPFGVMAALYLREYAGSGPVVSAVRIAINNLAGVPSIVFGVFGLGFFCYGVGGFIDGGPSWELPRTAWFVLLAILAGVAATGGVMTMLGMTRPGQPVSPTRRVLRVLSVLFLLAGTGAGLFLIATAPFFDGFFRASLPNPTFGKGALVWASFTLALLTLPVVIVATEEALAAVPNSMREGSYACGGSKWQTIRRIVLPRAMPGIMTGTILAMARGAGEVAPLMLVGAVKLAPELPVSWRPSDHFGIDRSFMHLGFHIYDLGFQSQNSEAAKPLVFTTTLLLITLIALLNVAAVYLRSRLRRRFVGAQF